ncbi:MAG: hypothetical protein JNJ83_23025 [Verrucomicrobiaceae bacterium]|nr:hypothetical protein [Verrucomicrobiaceae bacterium]
MQRILLSQKQIQVTTMLAFLHTIRFDEAMKIPFAVCLALSFLCPEASAMSRRGKMSISFHATGSDMESPRSIFKIPLPGETSPTIFRKVPEFSHEQIAAFHSFKAEDGITNGITLKLDFRGANALELLTRTRQGDILLAIVNGVPVEVLQVDTPVRDGIITIWKGVPDSVVDELRKKYPPIDKLAPVSSGDPDMIATTRHEKRIMMEEHRVRTEQDRIDANKSARKAEADALKPKE